MNKTRSMGVSGEQAAVVQRAEAQRERVVVQWDDGRYEGWVVDWEARSVVIKVEQERCLNTDGLGAVRPTHLLLYDDDGADTCCGQGRWLAT